MNNVRKSKVRETKTRSIFKLKDSKNPKLTIVKNNNY